MLRWFRSCLGWTLAVVGVLGRVAASAIRMAARGAGRVTRSAAVRSFVRVAGGSALLAALVLAAGAVCLVRIPPGMIGVQQFELGGRGIAERDHAAGIAFSLPLLESWHLIDGTTQVLTFGWESEGGDFPVLDLRTREGTVVKVGAAVVHRVRPDEAWQLVRDGLKGVWRRRVRAAAEDALLRAIGERSTAELCDTDARLACEEALTRELDLRLAHDHVRVERVLLTQVWFGPQYEKMLQAKQLAAQQVLLQAAATEVDAQRARIEIFQQEMDNALKRIASDGDQRIAERTASGKSEVAAIETATKAYGETRRAEAQAEHDRLVLDGDRLVMRSESLKEGLMRKALATSGGRLWLARQAAENLNIRTVTLNSNDPSVPSVLDLDRMVKLLMGAPVAAQH
jgi:hypothetical protein